MKKIKFALLGTLVIASIVVAFAFSTQRFATVTYFYKNGTCNQRIASGTTGQEDCRENSLNSTTFSSNSWTTTSQSITCNGGGYICSISFDEENDTDGGSDGQLTLAEALTAMSNYYSTNGTLPGTITVDGSAVITINKISAVH